VSFAQVSSNHRSGLSYSFRYFQDYDESIQLPPGLEPTRIGIEIRTGKDAAHGFRQAFVWKAQGMSVETEAAGGPANGDARSRGDSDVQTQTE
jgi:hypothetical protein